MSSARFFIFSKITTLFFVLFGVLVYSNGAFGQCPTTITYSSGTNSFTVPAGVTTITVQTWGGGGRGGFWNSTGTGGRGGGGGGAYSRSVISVTPGQTYTYVVGAGSNSNAAGGSSRFFLTAGPGPDLVRAMGGNSAIDNGNGAIGGLFSEGVGDFRFNGGAGANGSGTSYGGGGGSSAGTGANGNSTTNQTGATAPAGGGNGGNGKSVTEGDGDAGTSPGGGGGGSLKTSNGNGTSAGGAGANGQITISYSIPSAVGTVSADQTICSGSSPANMTIASATGTIQWQRADNLAFTTNVTNVGTNSTTLTSAQVGALAATRYFRAVVTNGTCPPANSAIITVTVDNPSSVGAVSANQSICSGSSPADMTIASATGTIQWQRADNLAFTTNVTNVGTNATSLSSAQVGTLTATRYFRAVVTNGTCAPINSAIITVTVDNPSAVGAVSANQTICSGSSPANMTIASATGTIQWQRADDLAFTTNVTNVGTNATTLSSAQVGTLTATRYFRAVVTNGTCTPVNSAPITVTVDNPSAVGTVSANQTICSGSSPVDMTVASATGTIQWQRADDLAFTSNVTNVGSNTTTLTSAQVGTLTATRYFRAVVTNGTCTSINSAIITVTVDNPSAVGAVSANQTICSGSSPTNMTIASATGTIQWQRADDLAFTSNVTNVGTNTTTLTTAQVGTLTATRYFRAVVTNGTCAPINSGIITVIVDNPSSVGAVSANQTICSGSSPANMTIASATGTIQWQRADDLAFTSNVTNVGSDATSLTSAQVGILNATQYFRAVVTNGTCTPVNSAIITVTVNPTPEINNIAFAVCTDIAFDIIPANGTNGLVPAGTTYTWNTPTVTGGITGGAAGSGSTSISGTLSNAGNTPQTATYTVTPVASGCIGSDFTITITVNPNTEITTHPDTNGGQVCFGDGFSQISVAATGAGTLTYQWFRNNSNLNTGGTAVSGATSATFTPPSTPEGTSYYYVEVTGTCGTLASNTTGLYEVFPPITVITSSPSTTGQTTCSGGTPFNAISFSATGAGTITYQWYSNTSPANTGGTLIPGATDPDFTPPNVNVGTLYYYATGKSDCGTVPTAVSGAFTVNPNPTANAGAALAAICQSGTSAAMGGSVGGGATGGTWSGGTGTWTNANNPATATYTAGAAETGTITFTLTTSGGSCGTTTATKTITVNPNPTVNAGAAVAAICQGATSVAMGGSVGGGATGGTWSGGAGTWTNATNPATATYTAGPAETGSVTLTLTTNGGSCGTTTATKTITVNPNPTVNAGAAVAAICQGATSAAMGGSVGGGATGGTWSGGAGTWTNANNPATATYTAGAAETGSVTLTLTTSGGSCGTTTATKTITVNPNPTANAGAAVAAICQGATSAAMGGSIGGGATGGTWSGGAGTWTNATNPATATYTAGAAESGSITLTLTTSGGSCGPTTATKTITVNRNPTVNPGAALAAICQSGTSAAMGGSVGGGATGGTWSGGTGTWTNANNPSTARYTAGAAETGTITLTLTTSGGSCGTTTATKTITVNPNPTVNAGAAVAAICQGATSVAMGGSVGGGATGGTWSGGAGTWTNANNPATATYTAGAAESGAITLTLTTSGGSCGVTTATKTITVNPNPTANAGAAAAAICQGATSAAMGGSIGGGATGGTWSGGAGTWTNATNPATATYTAGPAETGSVTLTLTTNGGSCGTTTATKTITVNPNPTVNAGAAVAAICQGATSVAMGGSVGGGATGGTWSGGAGTWTNANNPATATYTAGAAETGSVTLTLTTSGGSCGTTTATKTITVNPATAISSESLTAQTICDGQNFTSISVSATGTGTVTYQWYTNTTSNNTTGTSIPGATSTSYTPPSTTIGTNYYYVIASSDCGPNAISNVSGAFIVDPFTVITSQPDNTGDVECFGDGFDSISVAATGANLSYQWYSNNTNSNSGGTVIPGATLATFTPLSTTEGSAYYYVEVTGNCGVLTSDASGEYLVTPPITTINLNPSTSDEISCFGGSFSELEVGATGETDSSFPNIIYQWYQNTTNNNTTGTAITGANSATYTPIPDVEGSFYYYATAASKCGTVPTAVSGVHVVTPLTEIDSENLAGQIICDGDAFSPISIVADGTAPITYQWYRNDQNSTSTGNITTVGTDSDTYTPLGDLGTFYYFVEVSSTCGPNVISNVSGAFTVNPLPTVTNASLTQTICSGESTAAVTLTSGVAGTTFTWTATAPTGISGFTTSGTGTIPVQTISNTATTPGTVTYVITPTANGCPGPTSNYTVLVNPLATVGASSIAYPSVCISSPTLSPFTQTTSGVTGINQPGIPGVNGLPPGISATFSGNTITFSGEATTTGLYTYSIPLTGTCINGLTATGTIDVTPVYDITAVSSVSATTIGGSGTVTFYADPTKMLNGTYKVTYQIKQGSGGFTTVGPVDATVVNGKGTFTTTPVSSVTDTYTVQILTIKKSTDVCTVTLPVPPTTYFGVCSAVYDSNSTFYVPANVYSITIEVYGGGGAGGAGGGGGGAYSIRTDIPVTPGEPLGVIIGRGGLTTNANGEVTYVTRDSNIADQLGNSLVFANGGNGGSSGTGGTFDPRFSGSNGNNASGIVGGKGGGPLGGNGGASGQNGTSPGGGGGTWSGQTGRGGNGLVVISYSCPDADNSDCIKIIDDGSKSGHTVIEYTCDDTWTAPEGLAQFTVYVGSGGGGGGSGEGSGGGGSGALIVQTFTTSNPYGLPEGSEFPIVIGDGGAGAVGINNPGTNGESSSFTGTIEGNPINIVVPGGGAGGSQTQNGGSDGASGGGGGASPSPAKSKGDGGDPITITYSGANVNVTVYNGNVGGNGDYNNPQNAIAGGGGGGLIPWKLPPANDGQHGKAAGAGQGEGGRGGDALTLNLGDSTRYYGAGGGGIGEFFNGTEKIGEGGSSLEGVKLGGDGNLSSPTAVGGKGRDKTGSGGGAGYGAGGNGGKGIVYVVYFNFRILGVEFEYFSANYNQENRSGELKWATSKEWENSHFEIERSINDTRNWTKVGEVKGQGYSDTTFEYEFTDIDIPASGGNIFYRLKQLDFDGSYSYSVTRSIQVTGLKGRSNWVVYPNPSSHGNYVTVDLLDRSSFRDEQILIKISDVKGVFQSSSVSSVEEVTVAVNQYLDQAAPGIHIVQLIWGDHSEQLKILRR